MTVDEWSEKRDEAWDKLLSAVIRLRDQTELLETEVSQAMIDLRVCEDGFREARDLRLKVYEDAEQAIIEHKLVTLPWAPHVGELIMTAVKALEMHRSTRLSRGEMTDEEREAFVGDAKP